MPRNAPRSLIGRVRDNLNDLPAAERRLGDLILDFPGELASYTASELAAMAQVSNATVSRFFRGLGYDSFDAARRHVRAEQQSGAPLLLARAAGKGGDASTEAHIRQGHHNIDATFNRLPDQLLVEIAQAVVAARHVWIVGYRASHAFATYLRWQIVQAVERVTVIPGAGETAGEYLASVAATDCMIVFALRRTVPQIAEFVAAAAAATTGLAYVTDRPDAAATRAKWLIRCDTSAPGPLYNHVAVMALCDLLATKILEVSGRAGRKRMAAIEAAHDRLGELD